MPSLVMRGRAYTAVHGSTIADNDATTNTPGSTSPSPRCSRVRTLDRGPHSASPRTPASTKPSACYNESYAWNAHYYDATTRSYYDSNLLLISTVGWPKAKPDPAVTAPAAAPAARYARDAERLLELPALESTEEADKAIEVAIDSQDPSDIIRAFTSPRTPTNSTRQRRSSTSRRLRMQQSPPRMRISASSGSTPSPTYNDDAQTAYDATTSDDELLPTFSDLRLPGYDAKKLQSERGSRSADRGSSDGSSDGSSGSSSSSNSGKSSFWEPHPSPSMSIRSLEARPADHSADGPRSGWSSDPSLSYQSLSDQSPSSHRGSGHSGSGRAALGVVTLEPAALESSTRTQWRDTARRCMENAAACTLQSAYRLYRYKLAATTRTQLRSQLLTCKARAAGADRERRVAERRAAAAEREVEVLRATLSATEAAKGFIRPATVAIPQPAWRCASCTLGDGLGCCAPSSCGLVSYGCGI